MAIVTGGGTGIGEAICLKLARDGAPIAEAAFEELIRAAVALHVAKPKK